MTWGCPQHIAHTTSKTYRHLRHRDTTRAYVLHGQSTGGWDHLTYRYNAGRGTPQKPMRGRHMADGSRDAEERVSPWRVYMKMNRTCVCVCVCGAQQKQRRAPRDCGGRSPCMGALVDLQQHVKGQGLELPHVEQEAFQQAQQRVVLLEAGSNMARWQQHVATCRTGATHHNVQKLFAYLVRLSRMP